MVLSKIFQRSHVYTFQNGLIQELNDIRDSDVMMNEELIEIDEVDDLEDDYVDKKDKETLQMSMEALMASRSVMPKAATSHFVVNLVLNTVCHIFKF